MGNTESCNYTEYYTNTQSDEESISTPSPSPSPVSIPVPVPVPIEHTLLDIKLSEQQINSRNSCIHKVWYDMQQYLKDVEETLDYVHINSSGEIIRISKWLTSISVYFNRLVKHYKIPEKIPDNHWIYNHEIVDYVKKYAEENGISLRIESDIDCYIFIFN